MRESITSTITSMSTRVADIWERMPPAGIGWTILAIVAALTVFALVMNGIKGYRDVFSRKPPVDDDLRDLRNKLAGLAPSEKVDVLVDKIAHAATKGEVEQLRAELDGYVDQKQMDRRMGEIKEQLARVENDLSKQIDELQVHFKDEMSEFRTRAYAVWTGAEHQREGLHSRINVIAECVSEIRGWMRAVKLANPS